MGSRSVAIPPPFGRMAPPTLPRHSAPGGHPPTREDTAAVTTMSDPGDHDHDPRDHDHDLGDHDGVIRVITME